MQNKPNLLNTQMNVTKVLTREYKNNRLHRCAENKPNQSQCRSIPYLKFFNYPKISIKNVSTWKKLLTLLAILGNTRHKQKLRLLRKKFGDILYCKVYDFRKKAFMEKLGKGRVFGFQPGHYTWSFDDPYFRIMLLSGIAWPV